MAFLKSPKTEEEVKMMTPAVLRKAYNELASDMNKILNSDLMLCHRCNSHVSSNKYYSDKRFASGYFPICKSCVKEIVEQRNGKRDTPNETKASVQKMLQIMDLPYIDELYESAIKAVEDDVAERTKSSPFLVYLVQVKSLPQWRGKTWEDSEFEPEHTDTKDTMKLNEATIRKAKKNFGYGYSAQDYMFLQTQYDDWIQRYACESKAQEILFQRICFKQLDLDKAQKKSDNKKEINELDKSLQEMMNSLNIKPSQNNSNALTEAKTFGQLIQKWENEKPIPEPDEDFKDVDKVGQYIDVFFKGHLAKMMGLKNAFSESYNRFMKKYTVTKPQYEEDTDSEVLFDQIFGRRGEDE